MNPILADIYSTILPSAPYIIAAYALLWVALLVYVLMVFRGTKKGDRAAHASRGGRGRSAGEGPRGEGRVAIRDPCRVCCARSDSKWRLAAAVFRNIARLGDTPRRAFSYYGDRAKLETFLGAALPPSSFRRQPRSHARWSLLGQAAFCAPFRLAARGEIFQPFLQEWHHSLSKILRGYGASFSRFLRGCLMVTAPRKTR